MLAVAVLALCSFSGAQAQIVFAPAAAPGQSEHALPGAHRGDTSAIHSVAIISAVGQTMALENTGKIVPDSGVIDIKAWALDVQVETLLRDHLGNHFKVTEARADRAYLARLANSPWDDSQEYVSNYLRNAPHDGVDAFVAVIPDLDEGAPGLAGLTLEMGSAGTPPRGWANYQIVVVDAHSGEVVANAYSRVRLRDSQEPAFASTDFPSSLQPEKNFALSEAQMNGLRSGFAKLLDESLSETLRSLSFGEALPPPAARAIVPVPHDQDPFADIHSVAVVSVISDQLKFDQVGTIAFDQSHDARPIDDWHLDAQIETDIRSAIGKRFAVKDVAVDREHLSRARLDDSGGNVEAVFPGLNARDDVDAFVIVVKRPMLLWKHGHAAGLGVFNQATETNAAGSSEVYASYAVAVLDAHSLKLIRYAKGTVGPPYSTQVPRRDIDTSLWPENGAALTRAQSAGIENGLLTLMNDSIADTMLRMGLTGTTIAPTP
jgi:hypothetical protein